MSEQQPKLSLAEKAALLPAFVSIGFAASRAAIEWPFRQTAVADTFYHHIVNALARKSSRRLTIPQTRWIEGSFQTAYERWCRKQSITPKIITISAKARAFWLGDPDVQVMLIFYHGGGFAFDGNDGHLKFLHAIQTDLRARGKSLAILMVIYPLSPESIFPSQLEEAVNVVRYAVEDLKRKPSEIFIGGDSAGGNLATALLYHALHPLTSVPLIPEVTSENMFRGAILISPWVSFDVSLESFTRNQGKDYLQASTEKAWSDLYVAKTEPSPYNEPALASADQWIGLPVHDILVTAGSDELLLDGITKWVDEIKTHKPNVEYMVATGESHVAPIIWPVFGDNHETETGRNIVKWLHDRL